MVAVELSPLDPSPLAPRLGTPTRTHVGATVSPAGVRAYRNDRDGGRVLFEEALLVVQREALFGFRASTRVLAPVELKI